jgi:hypothetical protein
MFKIAPTVAWQVIQDETVIINLEDRRALGLNQVGTLIWSMIESSSVDQMTEVVVARYGADREVVRTDIDSFIAEIQQRGLVLPI